MLRRGRRLLLAGAAFIVILAFVIFVPVLYYPSCVEGYKSVSREFFGFGGYLWRYTGHSSEENVICFSSPGVDGQWHYRFDTG